MSEDPSPSPETESEDAAQTKPSGNHPASEPPPSGGGGGGGESRTKPEGPSLRTPHGVSLGPRAIVGVGASAGGLESLERFFGGFADRTGAAFIVVQHLSPDHETMMDALLRRHTDMSIKIAADGDLIRADHVYVIPPRKELTVRSGRIYLTDQDRRRLPHLPIDVFFESLSKVPEVTKVAVVLSGTGTDGSRGVKAIRHAGGLVLCESDATSKFNGMPRAASATGMVHRILPPEDMATVIRDKIEGRFEDESLPENDSDVAFSRAANAVLENPDLSDFDRVLGLVRERCQIDFGQYKSSTVNRRIQRRLSVLNVESMDEYVRVLMADPSEVDRLYRDMLIGVTKFFRDPNAWNYLTENVIDDLFRHAKNDRALRVWSVGCATGEEAYSMAILLDEARERLGLVTEIKIFASDVHPGSLRIASAAIYPEEALQHVDPSRVSRYFETTDAGYQIAKTVRSMVVVAPHNVLQDPPFTDLDLVVCRNLMIYFDIPAQQRALSMFHFGLRQDGVLFLGPSETLGVLEQEFRVVHDKFRIYTKISDARLPQNVNLPISLRPRTTTNRITPVADTTARRERLRCYDRLIDHVMPPSVLVSEDRRVLECFGGAEHYLRVSRRAFSDDLLSVVPQSLQAPLSVIFRRATSDRGPVRINTGPILLDDDRSPQTLDLQVEPLPGGDSERPLFLLRIGISPRHTDATPDAAEGLVAAPAVPAAAADRTRGVDPTGVDPTGVAEAGDDPDRSHDPDRAGEPWHDLQPRPFVDPAVAAPTDLSDIANNPTERIRSLEIELSQSRQNLQATIEELEASNEELQATNEELISSNEELQSTNEELNSVNEELHTVNVELQQANVELRELNEDINHLFGSIDIGTVFLDQALTIRRFTPSVSKIFDIQTQDIGRRLAAFSHRLRLDSLTALMERVLESSEVITREVTDEDDNHYILRLQPYRIGSDVPGVDASDITVGGVVMTLTDVTQLSEIRRIAEKFERRLQQAIDAVPVFVSFIDREERYEYANRAYCERLSRSGESVIGSHVRDVIGEDAYLYSKPHIDAALRGESQDFEQTLLTRGGEMVGKVSYTPERDEDGDVTGFYVSAADVTGIKRAERDAERAYQTAREANQAKSDFLAKMSHEIRSPMTAILGFADILESELKDPDNRNAIEIIRDNGQHLLDLINDILDLSRIESGNLSLDSDVFEPKRVVSECFDAVLPRAEANNVRLKTDFDDQIDGYIRGDQRRVRQVILNLLTNAVKFAAGGVVTLAAGREGDRYFVRVTDNGIGISAEALPRLFEPFCQADDSAGRRFEGTGLGLTITKQLCEQMGGSVNVHSELGVGSVFEIHLPWIVSDHTPVRRGPFDAPETLPRLDDRCILIIDDRRDIRFIAEHILSDLGAEVVTAQDGSEGIRAASTARAAGKDFDCIITDIQMPDMDGYETAGRLRADGYTGPLLALSASAMATDRDRALSAGCDEHMAKPIDRRRLVNLIGRMMGLH